MRIVEKAFSGTRLQCASQKSYDSLLAALLDDIGRKPVDLSEVASRNPSWDAYSDSVKGFAGPSGFMLFGLIDHGEWTRKAGLNRKAMRVILGNPLIAITMLECDLQSGLFAPVELLLLEEPSDTSSVVYVRPSTLMVVEHNQPLHDAAIILDQKLDALVTKITSN